MPKDIDVEETEEGLLRRAYALGLKLKHSNFDSETIYARLEKQAIPEELAKKVAFDITIERIKTIKNQESDDTVAWIKIAVGVLIFVISLLLLPGGFVFPIGLIVGGVLYFLLKK